MDFGSRTFSMAHEANFFDVHAALPLSFYDIHIHLHMYTSDRHGGLSLQRATPTELSHGVTRGTSVMFSECMHDEAYRMMHTIEPHARVGGGGPHTNCGAQRSKQ